MIKILGISGSIRHGSFNHALLVTAENISSGSAEIHIHSLESLPLYNDHLAKPDTSPAVIDFRSQIMGSDGLLIASPEYNYSMTGVLKNALDWAGTFTLGNLLDKKPVAIMGASRTVFGTARSQLHLRQVLLAANALVVRKPEVYIRRAQDLIAPDGLFHDERTIQKIESLLDALIMQISLTK